MSRYISFILIVIATTLSSATTGAAPYSPAALDRFGNEIPGVYPVHTGNLCHYWQHKCYDRNSDSKWRYLRCLRRRGCEDRSHHSSYGKQKKSNHHRRYSRRSGCRNWHNRCSRNWGPWYSDYYGCMRYHRCSPRYYPPQQNYRSESKRKKRDWYW